MSENCSTGNTQQSPGSHSRKRKMPPGSPQRPGTLENEPTTKSTAKVSRQFMLPKLSDVTNQLSNTDRPEKQPSAEKSFSQQSPGPHSRKRKTPPGSPQRPRTQENEPTTKSTTKISHQSTPRTLSDVTNQLSNTDHPEKQPSAEKKVHAQPSYGHPASLPAYITCVHDREEEDVPVQKDEPVIDFVQNFKPFGKSDNILFYLCNLEAFINPYVLCSALGEGDRLEIITIIKKRQSGKELPASNYPACGKGKFFRVESKGYTKGGATRKILSSDKYSWKGKPLAVFGCPDDTIEEAIMNDKRFHINGELSLKNPKEPNKPHLFPLEKLKTDVVYTVQIKKDRRVVPKTPKTKDARSTDQTSDKKDSQNTGESSPSVPHTSSDPQYNLSNQSTDLPENFRSRTSMKFSSEFSEITSRCGEEQVRSDIIKEHINQTYKDPTSAALHRLLTKHLNYVALIECPIQDNRTMRGTFILLTESLGLTCHHVLEHLPGGLKLKKEFKVKMSFKYEEKLHNSEEEPLQPQDFDVKAEYFNKDFDFVFLRLLRPKQCESTLPQEGAASDMELQASRQHGVFGSGSSSLELHADHPSGIRKCVASPLRPRGLLEYVAPPPQDGAVSIIGHPGGSFKKIDSRCSVINFSKRPEAIFATLLCDKSYLHVLTNPEFRKMSCSELITYDSCLYRGASGGPVFNDEGGLVAMHTGGYPVDTELKKKSVIEYGTSIVIILICGAIYIPELLGWFRKLRTRTCKLTEYLDNYILPNGHSVKMQPTIRVFRKHWEKPKEQNPDCNDSGIADSSMDTSECLPDHKN